MRCVIFAVALVSSLSAVTYGQLSPKIHNAIKSHFLTHCGTVNMYFCSYRDAIANYRATPNIMAARKVLNELSTSLLAEPSPHRNLVFIDTSCGAGVRLLEKNAQHMTQNYRWLIYVDDVNIAAVVLNHSRLELDSDVTLVRSSQGDVELLRLARMYFQLPLEVTANYSTEDASSNHKLSEAFAWRGEQVDLGGYAFRATTILLSLKHTRLEEWDKLLNKTIQPGVGNVRRYFTQLAVYLQQMYNFTLDLTVSEDWGYRQPNGTYTGAVGLVANREVEFGWSGVRILTERMNHLDFSFPILNSRYMFVLTQPKTFGTSEALFVPFRISTWAAFFVLIVVFIVVMRLTVLSDRKQQQNDSWGGSFLLVIGAVSQNGIPDEATKSSSRAFYFVTLASTFLIFSYYSVAILNGLILPTPNPIQNIWQLLASDLKLGGEDISYIRREIILNNDTATILARKKWAKDGFMNLQQGLERVRKGHFAFYALSTSLTTLMERLFTEEERCLITELQLIRDFPLSFYWRKESPFAEIFNRALIKMKERGIYDYIHNYWLADKPNCAAASLTFAPIQLKGMTLAYGVLAIGVFISLNAVVWEMIAFRIRKRRKSRRVILPTS